MAEWHLQFGSDRQCGRCSVLSSLVPGRRSAVLAIEGQFKNWEITKGAYGTVFTGREFDAPISFFSE